MAPEVREPQQKRAIEKKNRIIMAGLKLFSEKGYHNTNTAEIAKKAGVSTGVVYNYFTDKMDIFLQAINVYAKEMADTLYGEFDKLACTENMDLKELIKQLIQKLISGHEIVINIHEEIEVMGKMYPEVNSIFAKFEVEILQKLVDILSARDDTKKDNLDERVHVVFRLVEEICHEQVFYPKANFDYDILNDIVADSIIAILT